MSFSRTILWYPHEDLIWPDGTFKKEIVNLCFYECFFEMNLFLASELFSNRECTDRDMHENYT
jgi:hypothetical protein